jgi:hypothetical protein
MNWINAKTKLPDENAENVIYAARWVANREPLDILSYTEMCLLGEGKIRVDGDVYKTDWAILSNLDWLDEQ